MINKVTLGNVITLTKADLAEAVYKEHETATKKDAIKAVESFLYLSKSPLFAGDDLCKG